MEYVPQDRLQERKRRYPKGRQIWGEPGRGQMGSVSDADSLARSMTRHVRQASEKKAVNQGNLLTIVPLIREEFS
jgi:hypothetical protein